MKKNVPEGVLYNPLSNDNPKIFVIYLQNLQFVKVSNQVMEAITVNTKSLGPLSDDQLFQLCKENPNLRIERKVNGQLIFMTPSGGTSSNYNFKIVGKLYNWVQENQSGIAFDSSLGFRLPDGSMPAPDAAWIKKKDGNFIPGRKR